MTLCPLCPTQPHFSKLMRRKWLSSSEALDGIVGTLGAKALALRRMQDEPYQVHLLVRGRDAGEDPGPVGGGWESRARALRGERPLLGGEKLSQGEIGGALPVVCAEGARGYRGVARYAGGVGASGWWSSGESGEGWDGAPSGGRWGRVRELIRRSRTGVTHWEPGGPPAAGGGQGFPLGVRSGSGRVGSGEGGSPAAHSPSRLPGSPGAGGRAAPAGAGRVRAAPVPRSPALRLRADPQPRGWQAPGGRGAAAEAVPTAGQCGLGGGGLRNYGKLWLPGIPRLESRGRGLRIRPSPNLQPIVTL